MNKSYYSVPTLLVMLALSQGTHGDDKHTETTKNNQRTIPVFKEGEAQIVDEAVARKQNWKILPIYDMITKASRVVQEWMPTVYTQQRILRVVNPDGDAKELTLTAL